MNKKGTGRCRDPTGPEEKTINEKKGIVSFCWQGQELWQRHF